MNTTSAEHRKNTRVAIQDDAPELKLTLQFVAGGTDTRTVRAHDLSKTGMGFVDRAPIPLGTKCVLMLFHQHRPLRVIGKVTNCRATGDAGHIIGVKFISITPVPSEAPGVELTNDPAVDRLMIEL
jgi:hypothetical protein